MEDARSRSITDADLFKNQANNFKILVLMFVFSASFKLVQVFQQEIEDLSHSHERFDAHCVNELLPALQLLQRPWHGGLRPQLAAVPLPPLIDITRQ